MGNIDPFCKNQGTRWRKRPQPPKKLGDPHQNLPDFHLNPGQNLLEKHIVLIFQNIVNPNFSSNFKTSSGGTFAWKTHQSKDLLCQIRQLYGTHPQWVISKDWWFLDFIIGEPCFSLHKHMHWKTVYSFLLNSLNSFSWIFQKAVTCDQWRYNSSQNLV